MKDEIYKVAFRHEVPVTIVSNAIIRIPQSPLVTRAIVSDAFDAADDWIVERADAAAVVVTGDILLADRCLKLGATVIAPPGRPINTNTIGAAIATPALQAERRAGGDAVGGPAPFARTDRSRFLSALDAALVKLKRGG